MPDGGGRDHRISSPDGLKAACVLSLTRVTVWVHRPDGVFGERSANTRGGTWFEDCAELWLRETDPYDRVHASPLDASQEAPRSSRCTAIVRRVGTLATAEGRA